MSRSISVFSLAFIATVVGTVLASTQVTSSQTEISNQAQTPSSPVAYVYVSSSPSNGKLEINAYAAATNGARISVAGSPFSPDVQYVALNGAWLFGTNGINIDSFSIAANGALKQVDSYTAGTAGDGPGNLFLESYRRLVVRRVYQP
jgi:hypothetical protein